MEEKHLKRAIREVNRDPLKKYVLFLLNSNNNAPIDGVTKFMKELFFISKNIPSLEDRADFEPDNYGPNSDVVDNVLTELSTLGWVNKKNNKYKISEEGEKILHESESISVDEEGMVSFIKSLINDLTYDEFMTLTYYNYPDMTTESLVSEKIRSKRKEIALSLLKKNKISKSKAAEIYGVPLRDFYKIIEQKGIPIEVY